MTAAAIRDVARLEGIYPETAGGVTLAAVAAARRRGVIRPGDEVVALLTGNGLKTPDARTLGHGDGMARPGRAGSRAGDPAEPDARSSAGWVARHEHGPHPADAADRRPAAPSRSRSRAARSARSSPALVAAHPGLEVQLLAPDGDLNRFVNAFLNDTDVRHLQSLDTPVGEGDTLVLLPAMAGG